MLAVDIFTLKIIVMFLCYPKNHFQSACPCVCLPPCTLTFLFHLCRSITKVMRVVEEPADVLPNPRRYLPDYHLTVSTASYLSPNNSLIFIGTKKVNITDGVKEQANLQNITDTSPQPMGDHVISRPILDQIEPIYDTPFHLDNISHDLLSYWNEAPSVGDLRLADANVFIPSNLSIIPPSENCTASPCLPVNVSGHWFLLDTANFPEPRVNFRCELRLSEDYRRESSRSASWDGEWGE